MLLTKKLLHAIIGVNPDSLSHLGLNRYRVVTDGQTNGRTELRQLVRAFDSTRH